MAASTTIKARRALSDLFKEGTEIRFGLEDGKPVGKIGPFTDSMGNRAACPADWIAAFIRPPDPLQRDMAMREANAKRARALVRAKRDKDSEEHLTILAFLADMGEETLIDYVLAGDVNKRRADAEREILSLKEWEEMDAYQDAMRQFDAMTDEQREADPDWAAMQELDDKYRTQIQARENELLEAQREVFRMRMQSNGRNWIEKQALDRRADLVGTQAFIQEYELQMQFFSVRDPDDTSQLFYESAEELSRQPDLVRITISDALLPYIAEVEEAKNSQRADSGSDKSEPPSEPETSESSTREEQSVS